MYIVRIYILYTKKHVKRLYDARHERKAIIVPMLHIIGVTIQVDLFKYTYMKLQGYTEVWIFTLQCILNFI